MPLLSELDVRRAQAGTHYLSLIAEAASHLQSAGIPDKRSRVGANAPDFGLPAPDGSLVALSQLLKSGPVVISFFRGEWCAFCRAEIAALLQAQPEMARLGASLVLIAPETPSRQLARAAGGRASPVHILRDRDFGVALLYGLLYRVPECLQTFYSKHDPELAQHLDRAAWLLPLPADFIIAPDGTIALSYADPDFTRRLDPALIIEMLEAPRIPS